MNPVVGIDVAKGQSQVQAFLDKGRSFGKSEKIIHSHDGFERLSALLQELNNETGQMPVIVLEATGHYHRALVMFLDREGYDVIIVNPLQAQRFRQTQLRKVKTDALDAWYLAEMYYREDLTPRRSWESNLLDLQYLTRQHEFITGMYVQTKLNMRSILDQVFPTYVGVFRHLYSKSSLSVLECCLEENRDLFEIKEKITQEVNKSHSSTWAEKKATQVIQALEQNPIKGACTGLIVA